MGNVLCSAPDLISAILILLRHWDDPIACRWHPFVSPLYYTVRKTTAWLWI